jgi:hypothetical protein
MMAEVNPSHEGDGRYDGIVPQPLDHADGARRVIVDALTARHEEIKGEASPLDFDGASQILRALADAGYVISKVADGMTQVEVTKAAIDAGMHVVRTTERDGRAAVRELLEAATPLLGPRPLLDREKLFQLLHEDGCGCDLQRKSITLEAADWMRGHVMHWNDRVDAVLKLARPMPTREQIGQVILRHSLTSNREYSRYELRLHHDQLTDAVRSVLNGDR